MERSTEQRRALRAVLEAARRPLSVPEILAEARPRVPSMSHTTVYRNLKMLIAEGSLVVVQVAGQAPRYELASAAAHHHHHFHCERCDRMFDLPGCVQGWQQLVPERFKAARHDLTIFGTCAECTRQSGRRE